MFEGVRHHHQRCQQHAACQSSVTARRANISTRASLDISLHPFICWNIFQAALCLRSAHTRPVHRHPAGQSLCARGAGGCLAAPRTLLPHVHARQRQRQRRRDERRPLGEGRQQLRRLPRSQGLVRVGCPARVVAAASGQGGAGVCGGPCAAVPARAKVGGRGVASLQRRSRGALYPFQLCRASERRSCAGRRRSRMRCPVPT